ncbi:MAG: family 10 glycosylhydrolase [Prevotellaceae bacterium]|jgi:uncharacterized lipoprotein YddW (UPF0748 family)|nr:family 10 glycosylhydrolase [Prevotellaceae bacterium]
MTFKHILFGALCLCAQWLPAQNYPKREFRGAWIQTVHGAYRGLPTQETQRLLLQTLDSLQAAGINAVVFQVRPEADALYPSKYEPWSRWLTGVQGQAPNPYWDPMLFMLEQSHKRGMEFHAWVNPYRVKTQADNELASNHVYYENPERFFVYDNKLFFDPAYQENRNFICKVIKDIVERYDVDAIHMDDYFYPYPAGGIDFPDDASYERFGTGFATKGDWRRSNVNQLIRQIHETIRATKPWVKFGISPFGVYRNQSSDPMGSHTNALQNYDDLYADILLWAREGWVDYNVPQLYWQIGHPRADYETLVRWWAYNAENRPLYIGQSVSNTVSNADPENPEQDQMARKFQLERSFPTIQGSVQWPASTIVENLNGYTDRLKKEYFRYKALIPVYEFMDSTPPAKVRKIKTVWTEDGYVLFWTAPKTDDEMNRAVRYVVYRFGRKEEVNLEDPSHIVAITRDPFYLLPYENGKTRYRYVVTALDRLHNESESASKQVKL